MLRNDVLAVGLLTFVNLINYMDRYTIASVLPDVKTYYSLEDKEEGLLQTCFIVSYLLMAPIFGYLGDRYSRKYLMAFGVFFWSITTYIGSLVPPEHPTLFFFMRALVGTGEASYSTIAPTILGDFYIGPMRTKMLGVFYFAIPVGSGLGYIVGSQLATAFGSWKFALRLTPILGLISTVVMLLYLHDPPRGQADGLIQKPPTNNILADLKYFISVRSFIWSTVGFTCVCFTSGALAWWAPTYLINVAKASNPNSGDVTNSITLIFGVITALGGIIGVAISTTGANWYRKKTSKADPLLCAISVFASIPFIFAALILAPFSPLLTWLSIAIGITLLCINWTLVADMVLYVIVPQRRSFAQAIEIMASHLFGDATSPYIVGSISDAIKKGSHDHDSSAISLQYALYINCFVLVLGGLAFLITSFHITKDQARAKACVQENRTNSISEVDEVSDIQSTAPPPPACLRIFPPPDTLLDSDTARLIT